MKRVYASPDLMVVNHLKNVLESHGIPCVIKNTFLAGAAGELPPTECWPELWVTDEAHHLEAQCVLEASVAAESGLSEAWTCAHCGEEIEGQFTQCWNCGRNRPLPSPDG